MTGRDQNEVEQAGYRRVRKSRYMLPAVRYATICYSPVVYCSMISSGNTRTTSVEVLQSRPEIDGRAFRPWVVYACGSTVATSKAVCIRKRAISTLSRMVKCHDFDQIGSCQNHPSRTVWRAQYVDVNHFPGCAPHSAQLCSIEVASISSTK